MVSCSHEDKVPLGSFKMSFSADNSVLVVDDTFRCLDCGCGLVIPRNVHYPSSFGGFLE